MSKKKYGFFGRMKRSDNPAFEIGMFSISVAIALAVLCGVLLVGWLYIKGRNARYTEEEVNAGTVTQAAVEVDKTEEEPVPTVDPNADMIENDQLIDYDEELKTASFAYTTSDVNLRMEPSLTSAVIMKLPFGTMVDMVSYDGKEWAKVSYQGQEGYINAMYLSVTKPVPIENNTIEATPKPVKTPKPTPKPVETPSPDETEEPDYTEPPVDPTEEPTQEPEKTKKPAPTEAPPEKTEEPAPTEAPAPEE